MCGPLEEVKAGITVPQSLLLLLWFKVTEKHFANERGQDMDGREEDVEGKGMKTKLSSVHVPTPHDECNHYTAHVY